MSALERARQIGEHLHELLLAVHAELVVGWYAGTEARYMGDIMADDENTASDSRKQGAAQ